MLHEEEVNPPALIRKLEEMDLPQSSVKIGHNSKGKTWEVKVYNPDPDKAYWDAIKLDGWLKERYG